MKKKEKAAAIYAALSVEHPQASCSLHFKSPLEILISARLSAQCTDKRVNMVTPTLFLKYPTVESYADADISELMAIIKPCGLYVSKARQIKEMCAILRDKYGGRVPDTMEELLSLPGIGRKSANLVMGEVYGAPGAVVADTHCIRLSNRLGLCASKDPGKVERELRRILVPEHSLKICHLLVHHGREVCRARRPECGRCAVNGLCAYYAKITGA